MKNKNNKKEKFIYMKIFLYEAAKKEKFNFSFILLCRSVLDILLFSYTKMIIHALAKTRAL